jgi:tRNA(Ile)-lysidine synthase TilS/MesJ
MPGFVSPPSPYDILAQRRRIGEALQALAHRYRNCIEDPASHFFGMTREEFDDSLEETVKEQDKQAVLMLAASCEAIFRRDFRARVATPRNRRNLPEARFLELARERPNRVRLDDVLDVWQTTTGASLHDLRRLLKHRHWLAHGRYWSDKSGFTADPPLVFDLITSVFLALRDHTSDFPRAS